MEADEARFEEDSMAYVYRYLFHAMWVSWVGYWWAASHNVKANARRERPQSRLTHVLPFTLALALLWAPNSPIAALGERFLPPTVWLFWMSAVLTAAGLLFTVWARVHLGRNWSAEITVKEDHDLITSGPYRLVRHPIYTGLLLALVGFALARGEWRGVVSVALASWSLWRKLRIEERWMREHFGAAYDEYSRRVAALVPYVL